MTTAEYVRDYVIHVRFADGVEGDVDLQDELDGEPLRDPAYFRAFTLHPDLHTVTWPNGVDFAAEFLYEKSKVRAGLPVNPFPLPLDRLGDALQRPHIAEQRGAATV